MSEALYGFATGFATGLDDSIKEQRANQHDKEMADKRTEVQKSRDIWLENRAAYKAKNAADAARIKADKVRETELDTLMDVHGISPEFREQMRRLYDVYETPLNLTQAFSKGDINMDTFSSDPLVPATTGIPTPNSTVTDPTTPTASTSFFNPPKKAEGKSVIFQDDKTGDYTQLLKDTQGNFTDLEGTSVGRPTNSTERNTDMMTLGQKTMVSSQQYLAGFETKKNAIGDAIESLKRLDDMANKTPAILLTLAGQGQSAVSSALSEIGGLINLSTKEDANELFNENQAISKASAAIDAQVLGGLIDKDTADAYKVFQSDLIRTTYALGKAMGNTGQFSNQDFANILKTLNSGNTYEPFSDNLRNMASKMAGDVHSLRDETKKSMTNAYQYPSNRVAIDARLDVGRVDTHKEWFSSSAADPSTSNTDTAPATSNTATDLTPEQAIDLYGKGKEILVTRALVAEYPHLADFEGQYIQDGGVQE